VFKPAPALRWFSGSGRSPLAGQNPLGGLYLDYYFKTAPQKVTLQFLDAKGAVIRTYTSEPARVDTTLKTAADSLATKLRNATKHSLAYQPSDSIVAARAGTNRFVWDLRYPGAKKMKNTLIDEGTLDGPIAPPGAYTARLVADKDTLTRPFTVVADPRIKTTTAELVDQFNAVMRVRDKITEVSENSLQIENIQAQIDDRISQAKDQAFGKRLDDAGTALRKKFEAVRAELYEVGCHVDQCSLDQPMKLYNQLISMNAQVQSGDYAPTKQHGEMITDFSAKVAAQLKLLQTLIDTDLPAFNKLLGDLNVPAVFVPAKKIAM
jgi:hypothetical protein